MSSSDDDFRIKLARGSKSARVGVIKSLTSAPTVAYKRRKVKIWVDSSSDSDDAILSKTIHYPQRSVLGIKMPQNRTAMPKFKKMQKGDIWGDSSSDDDYEEGEDDETDDEPGESKSDNESDETDEGMKAAQKLAKDEQSTSTDPFENRVEHGETGIDPLAVQKNWPPEGQNIPPVEAAEAKDGYKDPSRFESYTQPIWTVHPEYPKALKKIIARYQFNGPGVLTKSLPEVQRWVASHKAEMTKAKEGWDASTEEYRINHIAYFQQYQDVRNVKNISNPVAAQPKGFEYEGETYDREKFLRVLFDHVQNWEHRTQLRVTARNTTKGEKERIVIDWLKNSTKDNSKDLLKFKQALEALKATKAPVQKEQPRSAATPSSAFGAQPISLSTPSSAEPVTEAPAKSSSEIKNDQSLKVKEESDRKVAQLEKEKAEKLAADEAHKNRVAEKTTTSGRLNEFLFGGPEGKAIADYDKEIASKKKLGEKAQGNIELRDLLGSSADTVTEAETDMEKARAPATSSSSSAPVEPSTSADPTEVPFDNFLREQNLDKDIDKVMPAINISQRMLSLADFGEIIKINDIEDALYKHILHSIPGDPTTPEHTWLLRRATDYLYRVSEAKYRAYKDTYKLRKIIHDRIDAQKKDIIELNYGRRHERIKRRRAKGMDVFESSKSQPRADDDPDVLSEKEDVDETAIEKQAVEELAEEKEQDDTVEQGSSPYNLQFDPATIKSYTSAELAKLSQEITLSPEKLKPSSAIAILEQLKDRMFAESMKLRESGQSWIPAIRIALTGRFVVDSRHGSVTTIRERIKTVISDLRGKLKEQAERYEKAENKRKLERALKQDKRKVKK